MSDQEIMPVFKVLRIVRDAQSTRGAQRALLFALAMRCQPAKKFISWPSYRQLAEDTMLDEVTLKRAAKKLEDSKLIRRQVRRNRSNIFFLNVALLQEQARDVKAAKEKVRVADIEEIDFFPQPAVGPDESVDEYEPDNTWNQGGVQ
jgi:DNA-binding MarR family transcriptional regulator